MSGARVRAEGWGWRHSGRASWALRGVDLTIEPGERVLLLGASGAGKSTLLHAMAGLTGDDSAIAGEAQGSLRVDGAPASRRRSSARVGLVGQDPDTQLVMARAGDDVAFGCENLGVPAEEIWPRVRSALYRVGFRHDLARSTAALSGGEKQRLVIAGALAMGPRLLLLDEPTAHLDSDGARLVRAVVADLAHTSGATLVLVDHRVEDAIHVVDRVVALDPGGGVVADGAPSTVFAGSDAARLAARGVWVPGRAPRPEVPVAPGGGPVVEMVDCVAREPAHPGLRSRPPATVLDGAHATLRAGTSIALTGPNGVGKSTLLMLLAGLARPDGGTVLPRGPLAEASERSLWRWPARRLARHVGTVFQQAEDQFVTGSVRAELAFAPRRSGMGPREVGAWVDELLERLRLTALADAHPATLSGGEKRRLSVATALSPGPSRAPDVLLLDEPTFGQDPRTWAELVSLLAGLRAAGRTVAMATHDRLLLDRFADVELRVGGGRVGER